MHMPSRAVLLVLALAPLTSVSASENQFINDFWMRDKAKPAAAPAPTPSPATPRYSPPARTAPAAPSRGASASADLVPAVQGLPPDPGDQRTYRIVPGDVLKVEVFQVEELSSEEKVSEDGDIVMPLIGPVRVAGMTPKEAEARLAAILGKDYLQNPQVDIDVTESTSQQVTVMGAVNKPGVFPIAGRTTLLQAIALAEGTDRVAKDEEVVVFRPDASGAMQAYVVDLDAIKRGELSDPILVGDDRVVVPESGSAVFIKEVADTLRGFVRLPGIGW